MGVFSIQQLQELNELEMEVYQYIIQHQNAIPYMRIRELAAEAHVSTTTVLRFCRKMGVRWLCGIQAADEGIDRTTARSGCSGGFI